MSAEPIGVVLAGGAGRRLGGAKATARLGDRTLVEYPLSALRGVVGEVVVVAKPDTPLPPLPDVAVWREPASPRHPLRGMVEALARAGGRPVLVCAVDLPFVPVSVLRAVMAAPGEVAVVAGQPLVGRYGASAAPSLSAAVREGRAARAAVAALDPVVVQVADAARVLFNVNTAADLAAAERMLGTTRT